MRRGLGFHARHSPGGAFSPLSLFTGGVQGAWYDPSDNTTLFSDRAGTTPCGTPGGGSVVPVGAMLDKRAAGYSVFFDGTGDYLVAANSADLSLPGDFTIEFWINFASLAANPNIFTLGSSNSPNNGLLMYHLTASNRLFLYSNGATILSGTAASAVTTGTWNHIAVVRSGSGSNNLQLYVNGALAGQATNTVTLTGVAANGFVMGAAYSTAYSDFTNGYVSNLRVVKGTAVYTSAFTPSGPLSPITGTSLLTCGTSWTGNPAITKNGDARVDGLNPFTASPVGNHAIAANDTTARPELRARVNLLTYSEQFDNAAWTKVRTTVSANTTATTDPLGGNTADKIIEGVFVGNDCSIDYSLFTHTASVSYTLSVYAKAAERTRVVILWSIVGANNPGIIVDLSTGTAASTNGSPTVSISNAGNGWWRIALTVTSGTPVTNTIRIGPTANTTSFATTLGYTGDGTSGIFLWGAQLTATNEFPANTYQRISDANTYDAVGFPRYLACNGTSSAMSTPGNVNLSGTDKVTVFAGVRKLSDVGIQLIAELSAVVDTNNGTMAIGTSIGGTQRWFSALRGTQLAYYEPATYAAPISNVLTTTFDIAGSAISSEIVPRVNGVVEQENPSGANAGTGNFGTYPLYIGSRNNAISFLNGNIYSLIVVGSAVSAGNITSTEQWVAGKVGITI